MSTMVPRRFYGFHGAVGEGEAIFHAGSGGDQIQIKFPLQTLDDDLQMEQTQKAAPEAKAQGRRGLGVKAEGGVVELQLFQSVLQVGVFGAVGGVDAAEHHGGHLAVAGQGLGGGVGSQGDGIAHPGIPDVLDAGGEVAHLAGLQLGAGGEGGGAHMAYLHHVELGPGGHHAHGVPGLQGALKQADIDDNALVAVVDAVEDQGLQGGGLVSLGGGDIGDHLLQHVLDAHTQLGRYPGGVQTGQTDDVFHLVGHPVGVGAGKVDLVEDGNQLQVMLQRHVGVGQSLGLHALAGVHHQHRAFTGGQAAAHLVAEVHMARGVDEVEFVFLAVFGFVGQSDGPGLDGDAPFPFQLHVVQQLVLHLPLVHGAGVFQNAVGQGGFAVVDMGDDTEIADMISCHKGTSS